MFLCPRDDAGQRFYFNIPQRRALRFGEITYLVLREFDVGDRLIRQAPR